MIETPPPTPEEVATCKAKWPQVFAFVLAARRQNARWPGTPLSLGAWLGLSVAAWQECQGACPNLVAFLEANRPGPTHTRRKTADEIAKQVMGNGPAAQSGGGFGSVNRLPVQVFIQARDALRGPR